MKIAASTVVKDLTSYFETCGLGDLVHYYNEIFPYLEQIREEEIDDDNSST